VILKIKISKNDQEIFILEENAFSEKFLESQKMLRSLHPSGPFFDFFLIYISRSFLKHSKIFLFRFIKLIIKSSVTFEPLVQYSSVTPFWKYQNV